MATLHEHHTPHILLLPLCHRFPDGVTYLRRSFLSGFYVIYDETGRFTALSDANLVFSSHMALPLACHAFYGRCSTIYAYTLRYLFISAVKIHMSTIFWSVMVIRGKFKRSPKISIRPDSNLRLSAKYDTIEAEK